MTGSGRTIYSSDFGNPSALQKVTPFTFGGNTQPLVFIPSKEIHFSPRIADGAYSQPGPVALNFGAVRLKDGKERVYIRWHDAIVEWYSDLGEWSPDGFLSSTSAYDISTGSGSPVAVSSQSGMPKAVIFIFSLNSVGQITQTTCTGSCSPSAEYGAVSMKTLLVVSG